MASCKKFSELINLYLDGEANDEQSQTLFSHLEECIQCRKRLDKVKAFNDNIRAIPIVKPPEGFHNQIMASLQNADAKKSHIEILRPVMNLAGIAVAIIMVVAIAWNISSNKESSLEIASISPNPEIYIVSPAEEGVVDRQYVDISAAFNDIDINKIRVILDTKDVTEATEINREFLIYTSDDLQSGYHIATIQIVDNKGAPLVQRSWTFYVISSEPI